MHEVWTGKVKPCSMIMQIFTLSFRVCPTYRRDSDSNSIWKQEIPNNRIELFSKLQVSKILLITNLESKWNKIYFPKRRMLQLFGTLNSF